MALLKNILIALIFVFAHEAYGALPELSADDPIEFDGETQELTAKNNAILTHDEFKLKADEVRFNQESFKARASGNVTLTHTGTRILADSIDYDFQEKQFQAENFRLGRNPIYLNGEVASGDIDHACIDYPEVIFGEPDCFAPNAIASSATVQDCDGETFVTARNILFRIGKIPFFYVPYFRESSKDIPLSMSSEFGATNPYGMYTRNEITVDANPNFEWGLLFDYYVKRGFIYGPTLTIKKPNLYSHIDAGFIHDNGVLGVDVLGNKIEKDRYFIEFQHSQKIQNDLRINAQVRAWKDSEVLRDFRPHWFANNQDPESFAEAIYFGNNYSMSLFSRFAPNDYQKVQERLPELNINVYPTKLGNLPIYQRINLNYARLEEKDPKKLSQSDLFSDRLDGFYGLHAPFFPTNYLTFTPLVGGRVTQYLNSSQENNSFTRFRGQIGFDLQMDIHGYWACCNQVWGINGIRHIIRPTLQYRYIPESNSGKGTPPLIERKFFSTNLQPIDLSYNRNRDESFDIHTMRIGLENVVQTRHECGYGSRDLAHFNFYQDYRIKKNHGDCRFSDFFTEIGIYPAYWLSVDFFSRTRPENWTLQELRSRVTIKDSRFWEISFTTDSLHHKTNQYYFHGAWHATPRTSFRAHWRYDYKLSRITEQAYGMDTRVGNSWALSSQIINRRGARREGNWEIGLVLRLVPFNADIIPINI